MLMQDLGIQSSAIRPTLTDFQVHYKGSVIGILLAWYRHTDQWDRIQTLPENPFTYSQLIIGKPAKTVQWGKSLFNK